jgi:quinol monooxygenase YgiN
MADHGEHTIVVAHFTAKSGKEAALLELLRGLIEPTRKEAGCLRYELNQEIENPAAYTFAEKFRNREAFDAHAKSPYIKSFGERSAGLFESRQVRLHRELLPAAQPELAGTTADGALIVIAHFTAKPGKEEELSTFLQGLVEPTRREPGCARYELNQDLDDPATFSFVETFVDQRGFEAHCKMPYIDRLFETLPVLVGKQYIGLHKRVPI